MKSQGSKKLQAWLDSTDTSQRQFVELSGLHLARLNRFLKGKAKPTLDESIAIREVVSGIDPADWL